MSVSTRPDSFELSDYLGVLRRRWWIVAVLTCVGLAGAGVYAKTAPKTYTATASVYVSATAANNNQALGRTSGPVNMDNEAQIVQSQTVAVLAARALHSPLTTQALVKQVSVAVPANTTVLAISCKAPTAVGAAACANDFASAYLSSRLSTATNAVSTAITALTGKMAQLASNISRLKARLSTLPKNSLAKTTTQLDLNADNGQLAQVEADINNLEPELTGMEAPGNISAGHVITPATVPTSPSSPRTLLLLPSGLLAGLLIGLLAAFFVDRRDDRVHNPADVERFLDLPVLLDIASKKSSARTALISPRSRAGQALTELTQYVAASLGDGRHVLLVAGTSAGSGGSLVAANLAATLARTRAEVVLVCADLRGSVAPQLLGVAEGRGLAEVLAGTATIGEVARRIPELGRLRVITPGIDVSAALFNLQHDVSRRLVADLRSDAGYVVIEAQSVGEGADTFTLAEFADAAIVAIEVSATSRRDAADCVSRLDRLRTPVLGAAVVPASGGRAPAPARNAAPAPRNVAMARPAPARPRAVDSADPLPAADPPRRPRNGPRDRRPESPAPVPGGPVSGTTPPADEPDVPLVPRGPGETWPLPRAALIEHQQGAQAGEPGKKPAKKAAGG